MLPNLQPWERIAWSPEHIQVLYRDLGLFYTQKQQLDIAAHYYKKSLELKHDDAKALFWRSKCKRNIAQTKSALEDSVAASKIDDNSAPINLEICDGLYEINQFESCTVELHENTRKYGGKKVSDFLERLIVLDENFKDSIGETLGPFILKNEKHFAAVLDEIEHQKHIDLRPLWKILKDQEKCDVLSLLEKEELLLSPREVARRERAFKVFNQIYFNKSWIDVLFLKDLRENSNLLLPQSKHSAPFLKHLTCSKYDVVKKFLKMLQARSPLYNEKLRRCPVKSKIGEKHREDHLNRIQYQTRRNMLTILRSIRTLRAKGKVERLSKYVEEVMGDYVVLKTHRVMPWKFEFLSEVYNTLALAHADRYINPPSINNTKEPILTLLRMPTDKNKDRGFKFVFGDRSTYHEPDATDLSFVAYKKFLTRLEKRMHFANYGIERCYLLHEIARSHLLQSRFDECCSVARKAVEESKRCNSNLWQFLNTMLIVKAHAFLHKIERCKEALDQAFSIAQQLKSPELADFIEVCRTINDELLSLKKRSRSLDSMRKRRSKISMGSRGSQSLSHISDLSDEEVPQQKQSQSEIKTENLG